MTISIIVPVYNEETTIGPVLDRIATLELDTEVIVVDDGSFDGTQMVLAGHATAPVIERLHVNGGKGAAIRRGLALAMGDIVVIQDADLELSPDRIVHLVAPILADRADAVYGSRFLAGHNGVKASRMAANRFLTRLTNLLYGTRLTDMETAHKAFRRDFVEGFDLRSRRFEIEAELTAKLARSGARIEEIANAYRPRTRSEGKKIRWYDGYLAIVTLLRYVRWRAPAVASR